MNPSTHSRSELVASRIAAGALFFLLAVFAGLAAAAYPRHVATVTPVAARPLLVGGRRHRRHSVQPGVHRGREPADGPTLAPGIRPFKDQDHGPLGVVQLPRQTPSLA